MDAKQLAGSRAVPSRALQRPGDQRSLQDLAGLLEKDPLLDKIVHEAIEALFHVRYISDSGPRRGIPCFNASSQIRLTWLYRRANPSRSSLGAASVNT